MRRWASHISTWEAPLRPKYRDLATSPDCADLSASDLVFHDRISPYAETPSPSAMVNHLICHARREAEPVTRE